MDLENFQVARIQEATRIGAAREQLRIAGEHLAVVNTRNLHAINQAQPAYLHSLGPAGGADHPESFPETYHRVSAMANRPDLTALSLSDNLLFFTYYMVMPPSAGPIHGPLRAAQAQEGLIPKVETASHSAMLENNPPL